MAALLLAEVANGALALDATTKAATAAAKPGEVTALVCRDAAVADGSAGNVAQLIPDNAEGVMRMLRNYHGLAGEPLLLDEQDQK